MFLKVTKRINKIKIYYRDCLYDHQWIELTRTKFIWRNWNGNFGGSTLMKKFLWDQIEGKGEGISDD